MGLSPEEGKRALWMVDGTGDTPLHTLVSSNASVKIIKAVLEIDPDLLFRENAVGRTPLEVAHDRFFADKAKVPEQQGRYRMNDNQEPSLVTTHLTAFVKSGGEEEDELDDKSPFGVIWKLCGEFAGKAGTTKRRLVSLGEANDVAERLGEAYMGGRYSFELPVVEVVEDEGEDGEGEKKEGGKKEKKERYSDFVTERYGNNYDAWGMFKDNEEEKEESGFACVCGGVH